MSSDLLDVDNDSHDTAILLSMKASGDAFLTISGEKDSSFYHLSPTEEGWKRAETIVAALNEWIKHTRQTKCEHSNACYHGEYPNYSGGTNPTYKCDDCGLIFLKP